jgi:hypothetical protein
MILVIHIIVAITSLLYTGYLYFSPSKTKLQIAYALVAITLITGFDLALNTPAHMTETCITGLVYLAFVSVGIFAARQKLVSR